MVLMLVAFNQNHGKEITLGFKIKNFVYSTDVKVIFQKNPKNIYII